ncbi:MAG: hypothetical protein C3F08_01570 [Candidatus Methylomirabilota bacterium]|nr:MAG: hypothetical protein C3F08_01570 [candidate division NC10 bacterium]
MSLESATWKAEDARRLLDDPMLKDAFSAVSSYLDQRALSCDPDNKEMAQRIILSKQLLAGVRREIYRYVEDGNVAAIRMAELEKKRGFSLFNR